MAILERSYTIPLRPSFRRAARYRKTNKAVKAVQAFLVKHMKSDEIRIGQHLNHFLWARGIKHPPPRVKVHVVRDEEGIVRAELEGKEFTETVKAVLKEEAGTLKEKLTEKLGGKEEAKDAEEKPAKAETPKATPAAKPVAAEKKPAAKPAAKPKVAAKK